jgi:transposase
MGQQMQVDFGEKKLLDCDGNLTKLWFIAFVLSHSGYKYVEWLDRPFTTADVIRTHENAFGYFGGMPEEIVYDTIEPAASCGALAPAVRRVLIWL